MPNISDAFPSRFLKANDLNSGDVVLTIKDVDYEELGQDRERKLVMTFRNTEKALPLNKTNAETLVQLLGDDTDDWTGAAITLYANREKAFGEWKDVVRIRPQLATKQKKAAPAPTAAPAWATEEDDAPDNEDIPF